MQSRFSVLFLLTCFMLSTACFSNQNTLTFNRPDNVPQANYVLELLTLAYKDIGYEIHLIDFNPQNALRAANNGTLDGQLGRDKSIEVDFPNLLPVNYPLFKFKLILYKNCQQSILNRLDNVAILADCPIQAQYIKNTQFDGNVIEVKNISTQLNLLTQEKVKGILLLDFASDSLPIQHPDVCYQKETLRVTPVYHYLNKQNAHLIEGLEAALNKLHNNGTAYALKAKYNMYD
ncbi:MULTISPECIES: substrate-binding periplasmic protein [Pseudoalteromonas]|uniref:substrate-binding periplasmic protein n=1 Tax=Pseudoalteromonas TaxID=53246 RepID=UPI00057A00DE|nr:MULTISPECIES: transporter substrate-binding domain-containing protein [Pseudoalteromonas]ATG57162.1 hypothetical protein CPA52_02400 [Pseudoalteromonas marina]